MEKPLYILIDDINENQVTVTDEDPQCPEIAGMDYGSPLRCSKLIHADDNHIQ